MAAAVKETIGWESVRGRLHRLAEGDPLFPELLGALAGFCRHPDELTSRRTVRYADQIARRRGLPRVLVLSAARSSLALPWPEQAHSLLRF